MRAWRVAPGPPSGRPLRRPAAGDVPWPGLGELLLRPLAYGVCRTDRRLTDGECPFCLSFARVRTKRPAGHSGRSCGHTGQDKEWS